MTTIRIRNQMVNTIDGIRPGAEGELEDTPGLRSMIRVGALALVEDDPRTAAAPPSPLPALAPPEWPPGVTAHRDADASAESKRTVRAAKRARTAAKPLDPDPVAAEDPPSSSSTPPAAAPVPPDAAPEDPLEAFLATVGADGFDPSRALDEVVVHAAAELAGDDPPAFDAARRRLKGAGVTLGAWDAAVATERRRLAAAEKAAERAAQREAMERDRGAREASIEERATELEELRATSSHPDHVVEFERNGLRYIMRPGSVARARWKRDELVTETLADFSAVVAADTMELEGPDAKPRRMFTLEVIHAGADAPRTVDVSAEAFGRGGWIDVELGSTANVSPEQGAREAACFVFKAASRRVEHRRYRFTGWATHEGRPVYLHAGGGIGAEGVDPSVEVCLEDPASRFVLPPPPTGAELARCLRDVVELVDAGDVMVPMVAQAFGAVLGGSLTNVYVVGDHGSGKSFLTSLVQRFYGAGMDRDRLPVSLANGAPVVGALELLASLGDTVVCLDDFRKTGDRRTDEASAKLVETVHRAIFNGAGRTMGRRTGGWQSTRPPRCSSLGSGQVRLQGASAVARVVSVTLDAKLRDLSGLDARASAGSLARAMATFVQRQASRRSARDDVKRREREAARAFGFAAGDRTADNFGPLALGWGELVAFLAELHAITDAEARAQTHRAAEVFGRSARQYADDVAEEDAGARFLECLRNVLHGGLGHVASMDSGCPTAPASWGGLGWSNADSPTAEPRPRGRCIGWTLTRKPGLLFFTVDQVMGAVMEAAERNRRPLAADAAEVARALHRAGALVVSDTDRVAGRYTCRERFPVLGQKCVWAIQRAAILAADDAPAPSATPLLDRDASPADDVPGPFDDYV